MCVYMYVCMPGLVVAEMVTDPLVAVVCMYVCKYVCVYGWVCKCVFESLQSMQE